MTELRSALQKAGAEIHIVKNPCSKSRPGSRRRRNERRVGGQLAVVTGRRDISSAAKVVKNFGAEFDRLKVQFGY